MGVSAKFSGGPATKHQHNPLREINFRIIWENRHLHFICMNTLLEYYRVL